MPLQACPHGMMIRPAGFKSIMHTTHVKSHITEKNGKEKEVKQAA
jgi:hypothetical protein